MAYNAFLQNPVSSPYPRLVVPSFSNPSVKQHFGRKMQSKSSRVQTNDVQRDPVAADGWRLSSENYVSSDTRWRKIILQHASSFSLSLSCVYVCMCVKLNRISTVRETLSLSRDGGIRRATSRGTHVPETLRFLVKPPYEDVAGAIRVQGRKS